MVSAAQVALNYGAYTFEAALALPKDVRSLLLGVLMAEEERRMSHLESVLGTSWDTADLLRAPGRGNKNGEIPARVRIPMLLGMAPEVIKSTGDMYLNAYKQAMELKSRGGLKPGEELVDMSTLGKEDWDKLMAMMPNIPDPK
jgi:hypothetical protein